MSAAPKIWHQLALLCEADTAEQIANVLQGIEALSVTMADAKDQPLFQLQPNDHPLWQDTQVTALFDSADDAEHAKLIVQSFFEKSLPCQIEIIEEQDWVRQTQQNFPSQAFGGCDKPLWVIPSWDANGEYAEPKIIIDPGLAFGTGTHPTTALCLTWLAEHNIHSFDVIDYGCGSGILSLGALAVGAQKVTAVDHDEQALEATQNNLALNSFNPQQITICDTSSCPSAKADLVIANILANPLMQLSQTLTDLTKSNGQLLLSGILSEEIDSVLKYYPSFAVTNTYQQEGWACISLKKS